MSNEEHIPSTQQKLSNSLNKLNNSPSDKTPETSRQDKYTTLPSTSSNAIPTNITSSTTSDATKVSKDDGSLRTGPRRRRGRGRGAKYVEGSRNVLQNNRPCPERSMVEFSQVVENQQQPSKPRVETANKKKYNDKSKNFAQPTTSVNHAPDVEHTQNHNDHRKRNSRWNKASMHRSGFQGHLTEEPEMGTTGEGTSKDNPLDIKEVHEDFGQSDREPKGVNRRKRRPNKPKPSSTNSPTELTLTLIEQLKTNEYECMICWENLGNGKDYEVGNLDTIQDTTNPKGKKPVKRKPARRQGIWNCETCYAMFHLQCVRDWSTKSQKDQVAHSATTPDASKGWRCPACQSVNQKYIPSQYRCFCGSVQNPMYSSTNTPHSCGRICRKHRKGSSCPHRCTLLCHPGPCPPCSALAPINSCHCGKKPLQFRCGQESDDLSCGDTCDKLLNCGKHSCPTPCHKGPCEPCSDILEVTCSCGKDNMFVACGSKEASISYTCNKVCGKAFECGEHICLSKCHLGKCNPDSCPLLPSKVSSCPCLKSPLKEARTKCTDPVPSCGNLCGKLLTCGHKCKSTCHLGPCKKCDELVSKPCVCHTSTIDGNCTGISTYSDQFSSVGSANELVNNTRLMSEVVIEDEYRKVFTCNNTCHKTLSCGRHKCEQKCCRYNDPEVSKGEKNSIHTCARVCGKKLGCGKHTCELPCHPGKCNVCLEASFEDLFCYCGSTVVPAPIRCGTKLPSCQNPCTRPRECGHPPNLMHSCHFEDDKCPPCCFLVSRSCRCGSNVIRNIPCYKATNPDQFLAPSCGMACGKMLQCGHKCSRVCHSDPCETVKCQSKCERPRKKCDHTCKATCHDGVACPEVPCSANVTRTCSCTRLQKLKPCGLFAAQNEELDDDAEPQTIVLPCDNDCRLYQRNRKLAEALNITKKDSPSEDVYYTELLVSFTRSNMLFVKKLEETLAAFVKNTSKRILHLSPMKAIQRAVVHEIAKFYQLDSESVDLEPKRSVILHKNSTLSKIPQPLISEYIAQGGGVNVPSEGSDEIVEHNAIEILGLDDDLDANNLDELLKLVIGHGPNQFEYRWLTEKDVAIVVADTTGEPGDVERKVLKAVEQLQPELASLASSVTTRVAPVRGYRKTKQPPTVQLLDNVGTARSSNMFDALEPTNPWNS